MDLNEKKYLIELLSFQNSMFNEDKMFSVVKDILSAARELSGRNIKTGIYEKKEFRESNFTNQTLIPFYFTGLINYLILLDILGSIIRKKNCELRLNHSIHNILECYTDFNERKIKAVRALRNSLTHKFGLATEKGKEDMTHKFILSYEMKPNKIIELPLKIWDGNFDDKSDETSTKVYLFSFEDLVERIYKDVIRDLENDKLEFRLSSINELKARLTYQ